MLDETTLVWLENRKSPHYMCKTYCEYFYEFENKDNTKEEGCCMFPADSCFIRDDDYKRFNLKSLRKI